MPTKPPITQASWSVVSLRAKALVRTRSGTSRWIVESSDSLARHCASPATKPSTTSGEQAVEQGAERSPRRPGQQRQDHRELRVHPLQQRADGDADEVAEAGRADDDGEQELRRVTADRVLAQQERHEEREEAREPARAAVGPERERHRRRGSAPCRGPARVRRPPGSRPTGSRCRPRRASSRRGWGSRIARTVARRRPRTRSAATTPARPIAASAAIGAETATPTIPASEIRALALTRVQAFGQQPGYGGRARDAVRLGRDQHAQGRREQPDGVAVTDDASTQHRKARAAIVAPIAQRRPWLKRSRNGPISGATIANGSIVSPRNSATCPRASPVGTWKNSVPASEIATRRVAGGVEGVQLDQPGEAAGVRRPRASAARRA